MRAASLDEVPAEGTDTVFNAHVSRLHRGYIRHISLVRVRGFALRVKSASFGRVAGRALPLAIAVRARDRGGGCGESVGDGNS